MRTIEYKVSFEKMISRLPGLFAYLESDEFGIVSLHKATDSLDGCWGKIVENIKLPNEVELAITVDENVTQTILHGGNVYSFRTIIDYYYQYKETLGENDVFVKFINEGIGKIKIPDNIKKEATPDFVYLSNVKRLYNELVKMDKQCEFYEQNLQNGLTEKDKYLCCLCERYEKMGGDAFKNYIQSLIATAEFVANKYYQYAQDAIDDNKRMKLDFDVDLTSTYQDSGIMTMYTPQWIPGKKYYKGDKVIYDNEIYLCKNDNTGKFDNDLMKIVFDTQSFEKIGNSMKVFNDDGVPIDLTSTFPPITGKTDTKLVQMRRFVTYVNNDNTPEKPKKDEDWLFYYRKGYVTNIRTITDELGNVVKLSDLETASKNKTDLAAYGDVIEDITVDTDERKIKFKYRLDVHLKADGNYTLLTDRDGNEIIKWDKFIWDNDEKIGVKYEEEYNYEEESNLDKLINGTFSIDGVNETFTFQNYINGLYDDSLPTFKFEFITINNSISYEKSIAHQDVSIVSILTDFEVHRNDFNEFIDGDLIREDYLHGITYQPTRNIDVRIERGSTSVFEKHIAFGEVKTIEDMETYKNSSFFKMNNS